MSRSMDELGREPRYVYPKLPVFIDARKATGQE